MSTEAILVWAGAALLAWYMYRRLLRAERLAKIAEAILASQQAKQVMIVTDETGRTIGTIRLKEPTHDA